MPSKYVTNPLTGRKVLRGGPAHKKSLALRKKCKGHSTIKNPKTGRCGSTRSKGGCKTKSRPSARSTCKTKTKRWVKPATKKRKTTTTKPKRKPRRGYKVNPLTGRMIKIGGPSDKLVTRQRQKCKGHKLMNPKTKRCVKNRSKGGCIAGSRPSSRSVCNARTKRWVKPATKTKKRKPTKQRKKSLYSGPVLLDYKNYLYYVSKEGHIMQKTRGSPKGVGVSIYKANAVVRRPGMMYFVKPDGTVDSTPLKTKGKKVTIKPEQPSRFSRYSRSESIDDII